MSDLQSLNNMNQSYSAMFSKQQFTKNCRNLFESLNLYIDTEFKLLHSEVNHDFFGEYFECLQCH